MGRARITLKPISNERSRKSTFIKRSKCLIRKINEFSTLCGVEACLIVYSDDDDGNNIKPVTWPEDPKVLHSIIEKYKHQKNEKPPKIFGVQDFVENRKSMLEAEISKVQKQISSIKYPSWNPCMASMEEEQLRAFIAQVDAKIMACAQILKNKHQSEGNFLQDMACWGSAFSSSLHPIGEVLNDDDDDNRRVDFANSMNQFGGASYHGIDMLRNMQHGDACFGFVPNMTQESATATANANATFSHSSQLKFLQKISLSQPVLEDLEPLEHQNEMVDFTNQAYVSQDSTNQLGDSINWFDGHVDWSNIQLGGDLVGQTNQPDESIFKSICVQSQNEQLGGGAILPPPLDVFQTDCYNVNF